MLRETKSNDDAQVRARADMNDSTDEVEIGDDEMEEIKSLVSRTVSKMQQNGMGKDEIKVIEDCLLDSNIFAKTQVGDSSIG